MWLRWGRSPRKNGVQCAQLELQAVSLGARCGDARTHAFDQEQSHLDL